MSRIISARRARLAGGVAGAVGALSLLAAGVAQADVSAWGPTNLAPGFEQCVSLYAYQDAYASGSADEPGAVFKVFRNNVLISSSGSRTTYFGEYFYGPGNYRFCGKNPQALGQTVNNVTNVLFTDQDA